MGEARANRRGRGRYVGLKLDRYSRELSSGLGELDDAARYRIAGFARRL
jgi:hypothetical protein